MTAKLIALYKAPADPKEFDTVYFEEHIPIAQKIPGLRLIEISKVNGAPSGEAAFYLMAELYFDDMKACKEGIGSPEGVATREHVMSFAGDLVTLMYAEVAENN